MSTGGKTEIRCECGHVFEGWLWQSANVTGSPELLDEILDGKMNVVRCPSCRKRFHVEIPFLYHDVIAREWIWVYPHDQERQSAEVHARVREMWEEIKGKIPEEMREIFENQYKVIVLFGMDALLTYLKGKAAHEAGPASR